MESGVDLNGYYGNALQAASLSGHREVVELLLNKGADVNTRPRLFGNGPQAASANTHPAIVDFLLERGAINI
jgi:ankyrin repeat protein